MSFRERLQRATDRGKRAKEAERSEAAAKALSEEELRRLHTGYRLSLSEHIERCLHDLADNFPGFRLETVVDGSALGSIASRDDVGLADGKRAANFFSRLQVAVSGHNQYNVLDVTAKGTIRNKEVYSRSYYQQLDDVDLEKFQQLIEGWVLEYAEQFAAAD